MNKLFGFVLMGLALSVQAQTVKPEFFEKAGIKVVSSQVGPSGLTVWRVEKAGTQTVFYTTSDGKTLMSGVLWDAKTGANLSDAFIPDAAAKKSQSGIPDAIRDIDTLVGFKEGKGPAARTLFIMFDPRCPHCHNVFKKTRAFVSSGGTIKWIPLTILGRKEEGAKLVADILQSGSSQKVFAEIMSGSRRIGSTSPNQGTLKAIVENEAYFFSAFDAHPDAGTAGVPVAFFMQRDGRPQMVAGIDDDALLSQIMKDMK